MSSVSGPNRPLGGICGPRKGKRMKFYGFQKMTLLDYPGKVACTVFTGGCNFRCPFCHNALLVTQLNPADAISDTEILTYLKKRQGLLDGVCVTGGEPLLWKELPAFLAEVKSLGYAVKLDTNGSFPETLKALVREKLVDYAAMDIKNSPEKYALTAGLDSIELEAVGESIRFLLEEHIPYEFRTTVTEEFHTVEDIRKAAEWIRGAEAYFLQGFVDSGNVIGGTLHPQPKEVMEQMREAAAAFVPSVTLRGV